jgi:hypothetical protein
MAGATLDILIKANDEASKQIGETGDAIGSLAKKVAKFAAGALGAAAIVDFGKKALSAASDLEQAVGGTDAVFGKAAKSIHDWAADTTDNVGLSKSAYESLAVLIGAQLKNAGVPIDQMAGKTKELMERAADMAAMFGGTTASAVDALSAALKGEPEQLERYAAGFTAVEIKAKAFEMGLGDLFDAGDPLARQQATIALAMDKTAVAAGSAERESMSYATQQENLTVAFDNLLAAIGGPLLSVFSGFMSAITGGIAVIEPFLVLIAELVGWVLDLPGPFLAATAAVVGFQVISNLVGGLSGLIASLRTAGLAVQGFLASIGPVGWAIIALSAAFTIFEMIGDDTDEVLASNQEAADALTATLDQTTGAVTDATRAMVVQEAQANGLLDTMERLGVDTSAYTDAATGAAGGTERLAAELRDAVTNVLNSSGAFNALANDLRDAGVGQLDFAKAVADGDFTAIRDQVQKYAEGVAAASGNMGDASSIMATFDAAVAETGPDLGSLASAMDLAGMNATTLSGGTADAEQAARAMGGAAADAAADTDKLSASETKLQEDAAKAAAENSTLEQAMGEVEKASSDATRALEFFSAEVDKLTGRHKSADEAAAGLNEAVRGLGAAFKDTGDKGGVNTTALMNWDAAALTATEAGAGVYDAVNSMRDAYDESTIAAYEAAGGAANNAAATAAAGAAADDARAKFIGQHDAMGLTEQQAADLATNLGILDAQQLDPKIFQLIAEDQQAKDQLAALSAAGIPQKSIVVVAETDPATQQVHNVLKVIDASGATVDVDAAITEANKGIKSVESANYAATVTTGSDTADATKGITTVAGATYNAHINTSALVSSAQADINKVADAYYKATIHVVADTSGFTSAFNNLPTSKGVAMIPPPVAAPTVGLFAAPALAGTPGNSKSWDATHTVQITVNGALDPDAVARQIGNLMTRRERRSGPVMIR